MNKDPKILELVVQNALSGKGAHAATANIFDGLDWESAGKQPVGAPHSAFQILHHMSYWQDWGVKWLGAGNPKVPAHAAAGWPGKAAPANAKEWQGAVRKFRSGLAGLERQVRKSNLLATRGKQSRVGMLAAIASHNSHHAGQIVLLRQLLGKWPPPSGGVTW